MSGETVYLSGPITGIADYAERFAQAESEIRSLGVEHVINPARLAQREDWVWADYMLCDLSMLRHATAIVMLPGWQQSKGAMTEAAFAAGMGIPIVKLKDAAAWISSREAECA